MGHTAATDLKIRNFTPHSFHYFLACERSKETPICYLTLILTFTLYILTSAYLLQTFITDIKGN